MGSKNKNKKYIKLKHNYVVLFTIAINVLFSIPKQRNIFILPLKSKYYFCTKIIFKSTIIYGAFNVARSKCIFTIFINTKNLDEFSQIVKFEVTS